MCRFIKLIAALCVLSVGQGAIGNRLTRTSIEDHTIESVRVDMKDEQVLRLFNLTADELKKITQGVAATKAGSTAAPRDSQRFNNIKEHRVGDIRNKIKVAITGHGTVSNENADSPQHEMAAYPICGSGTNETSWLNEQNVTIQFSNTLFEPRKALTLDSAILRLYKLKPNQTVETTEPTKGCAEPKIETQIRVTVSIVLRKNRREKRKRICNTVMLNVSQSGWIEIDIKHAIHIWERQNVGSVQVGWLMIEVHDDEERPLKPGLYFRPPKCDQADPAIPWNFYQSALPLSFTEEVPRSPRIDLKLTGYAALLPHNPRGRPNFNINRELYRLSHRNPEESTTSITPTDNLLDPSASTEVHRHRQRHARHHRHHSHNAATTLDDGAAGATVATGSTRSDATSIEDSNGQMLDC